MIYEQFDQEFAYDILGREYTFMEKRKIAKELTGGIFGSLTDMLLWTVYVTGTSFGKSGSRGVYHAFQEADEMLARVNHRTILAAWENATKKRLVVGEKRDGLFHVEITSYGRKRLQEITPTYDMRRLWDGKVYLVTFDIPETARKKRDLFRYFLRMNRCRLLQESVWLTPYNPRVLINEFIHQHSIAGTIIVSDIGKDGGIGESTIQEVLAKLYGLEKLNNRYSAFISQAKKRFAPRHVLLLSYLSILSDDPQLPFPILPGGWLGNEAYQLYNQILFSR